MMAFLESHLLGWLPLMGALALLWVLSIPLRNVSIVDIAWGPGFGLAALGWWWQGGGAPGRQWLALGLVGVWGLRLGAYLAWRNVGKGEDFRYQAFRAQYGPARYWWISFFQVFLLQGVLIALVGLPVSAAVQIGAERPLGGWDIAGVALWLVGMIFETGGDLQLARFKANPANRGKVLDAGFWALTRHPNYFGDAAVWWGLGLIGIGAGAWWAFVGPVLMTGLLLKVSGVALLEKTLRAEKPEYAEYVRRTSAFLPWPKRR